MEDRRTAEHECGHAVMAWLCGRVIPRVTLYHPLTGGGMSIDLLPRESLRAGRPPFAHWHMAELDCLTVLAGQLSEGLDHDDIPPLPLTPQRVPDDDEPPEPYPDEPPIPLRWQSIDDPSDPERWQSDSDQVYRLTAGIASSEAERAPLELTLRYRAEEIVQSPHFKALHKALTEALMRDGDLYGSDVECTLKRAELGYLTNAIPEADYAE
jgi:hypothetical protein